MKILFVIHLLIFPFFLFSQASRSYDFDILIKFEKDIPIRYLTVYYYKMSNNHFNKVNYKMDTINNTIKVFGSNNAVVGTSFPTLVFSLKSDVENYYQKPDEIVEKTFNFYLISGNWIESYTKDFTNEIKFSNDKATILVETNDDYNGYKVRNENTYNGVTFLVKYSTSFSNTMIRINEL